jgi:predicted methyltransferase
MMIGAQFTCSDCEGIDIVHANSDLLEKLKCKACRFGGVDMNEVLDIVEKLRHHQS